MTVCLNYVYVSTCHSLLLSSLPTGNDVCNGTNPCAPNGNCVNSNGSFTCDCFTGYMLNPSEQNCSGKYVVQPWVRKQLVSIRQGHRQRKQKELCLWAAALGQAWPGRSDTVLASNCICCWPHQSPLWLGQQAVCSTAYMYTSYQRLLLPCHTCSTPHHLMFKVYIISQL